MWEDDDWMNPPAGVTFAPKPDKARYLIERARKQICFGNPGFIVEWRFWSSYETADKRNDALKCLNEKHPSWHLRVRDRNPELERLGIYPPISRPGINEPG